MAGQGNKLRCTLCLEEIDYLENPKQLPCTHVYCLPCLKTRVQTMVSGEIQVNCLICSEAHAVKDLGTLPEPTPEDQSRQDNCSATISGSDTSSLPARCDKCKDEVKEAVCYCADCDRKFCNHHTQAHNDFHDDGRHRLVEMKKYLENPGVYTKPKCELHGYDIGMCCEKCFCLRCPRCKTENKCHGGSAHILQSLEDTEPKLRSQFSDLLKECADKLTEMCKLEKETWLELDEYEEKCDQLLKQVESKAMELVNAVRRESIKYKDYIRLNQQRKKQQTEEYLQNMRVKRDEIEQTRLECELLLRNHHVTEIIKQREERILDLRRAKMEIVTKNELGLDVLNNALNKFLEFDIELPAEVYELLSTHYTPALCYSVTYTEDEDILASCNSGLYLYTKSSNYAEFTFMHTEAVNSAAVLGSDVWYVESYDEWEYVKTAVLDDEKTFVDSQPVFKFKGNRRDVISITVCDGWIVVTDPMKEGVIVYHRNIGKKWERKLDFFVLNVHFDVDGTLLVSGGDALRKYRLGSTGELALLWKSTELSSADGIAERENGQILVKGDTALYILSARGILLSSYNYDGDLTRDEGDIGLSPDGTCLSLPFDDGFKVFSLL